ncbi:uncharacterized protein TNCV_1333741 [Trichonephila clavipes]|nr:uncharacterized protein TNCV_1333741 [Trichonephila clavipes]
MGHLANKTYQHLACNSSQYSRGSRDIDLSSVIRLELRPSFRLISRPLRYTSTRKEKKNRIISPTQACSTNEAKIVLKKSKKKKATRGLLATDHVILNHGQVTWTAPELAPPLQTTTPHQREDILALDRSNVHRCPTRRVFSDTGLELVTRQATIQYLYHSACLVGLISKNMLRCRVE